MDANSLLIYVLIPLALILLIRKVAFGNPPPPPRPSDKKIAAKKKVKPTPRGYTKEEVANHKSKDDCWLIIDGKVYDVTPYISQHMGGDAILRNAGADSSSGFHGEQHPDKVAQILPEFEIGWLEE